VPLALDYNEAVAGKEGRRHADPAAAHDAALTGAWEVRFAAAECEAMECECRSVRPGRAEGAARGWPCLVAPVIDHDGNF
jgi:hypothetical protein